MGWEHLGPLGIFLGVVGGGIAWVTNLWLGRTDRREERMIALLQEQKAQAEKEAAEEKASRIAWERRAISWYKQLVDAGHTPDPEWGVEG